LGGIEHNAIRANAEGILLSDSFGDISHRRNLPIGNGSGITLRATEDAVIKGNRIFRSRRDEILLHTDTSGNVIWGNVSSQNGEDAIDVDAPEYTETGDRANGNGNLGIEAASGTIDGGGNRAHGNANPLQCLNVFCCYLRARTRSLTLLDS
jgi:hypothetical protein